MGETQAQSFGTNYSTCTSRSSEIICSSSIFIKSQYEMGETLAQSLELIIYSTCTGRSSEIIYVAAAAAAEALRKKERQDQNCWKN
jgi:hypothetical protein